MQVGPGAYRKDLKQIVEEEKILLNLDIDEEQDPQKKGYVSIGRKVPTTKDVSKHDYIHYIGD